MALRSSCRAHVNETTEPVDNLGGILSVVLVGALVLVDQLRAGARARERWRVGLAAIALAAALAFVIRQRRAANPLYDLEVAAAPNLLGRRLRRDHRLRDADGRDVHRPAVPAERARLLDVRGRARDPAGRRLHGAGRAALGEARRGVRRPVHAARRATPSACSASSRCCCSGTRTSRTGRSASATRFLGIGVGFAGTPASHSLTGSVPVRARRHGLGDGRPPARPRRRDHAVDLRRAAHGRVRRRRRRRRSPRPGRGQITDSVQSQLTKSFASAEDIAAQYPQYASRSRLRAKRRSSTGPLGLHGRDRRDPARRDARLLPLPEAATRRSGCSPQYHAEDTAVAGIGGRGS